LRVWLSIAAVVGLASCAHEGCVEQSSKHSGAQLFQASCAACHGSDAHGNGPVAEYIAVPVPDLTLIQASNAGKFPAERIYRIIDGQFEQSPHGARHMPIWGYEFFAAQGDDQTAHKQAADKIDRLVEYLRTQQR
jgi:mono/diheme cytochrome c family protein